MTYEMILYDAFTGIGSAEKNALVSFLHKHSENTSRQSVQEAVEYAVKHKPSFGGFILTAYVGRDLIAAIVANRTGMEEYNPKNIFVFVTLAPRYRKKEEVVKKLMEKAIHYADGEIALHVEPGHPALKLYERLGFKAQYLELRFSNKRPSAVA